MNFLVLGDIFPSALPFLKKKIPSIIKKNKIDFVIANGENAGKNGMGITKKIAENLFKLGINVITSGNHIWHYKEILDYIEKNFNDTIRIKSQLTNRKYEAIINGKKQNYSLELTTTGAGTLLKKLFETNELYFDAPKNTGYLKLIFSLFEDNSFSVLDFFAGSGSSGHAVMQLNAEDGGNRKFILCQIDEPIKEDKPAYKFCIDNKLPPVISSITVERLKRAGEKIAKDIEAENSKAGLFEEDKKQVPDIGFKVFDSIEAPHLK